MARIAVLSEDALRWRGVPASFLPVRCCARGELDAVQRELRAIPGVTALIYDQVCATEQRRRIKRGLAVARTRHVFRRTCARTAAIARHVQLRRDPAGARHSRSRTQAPDRSVLQRRLRLPRRELPRDGHGQRAARCAGRQGSPRGTNASSARSPTRTRRPGAGPAPTTWSSPASAAPASSRSARCWSRQRTSRGRAPRCSTSPDSRRKAEPSSPSCGWPIVRRTPPPDAHRHAAGRRDDRLRPGRGHLGSGVADAHARSHARRGEPARGCRPPPSSPTGMPTCTPPGCWRRSGMRSAPMPSSPATRRRWPIDCSATRSPPTCCCSGSPGSPGSCPSVARRSSACRAQRGGGRGEPACLRTRPARRRPTGRAAGAARRDASGHDDPDLDATIDRERRRLTACQNAAAVRATLSRSRRQGEGRRAQGRGPDAPLELTRQVALDLREAARVQGRVRGRADVFRRQPRAGARRRVRGRLRRAVPLRTGVPRPAAQRRAGRRASSCSVGGCARGYGCWPRRGVFAARRSTPSAGPPRRAERALADEYAAAVSHSLDRLDATTHGAAVRLAALPGEVRGFGSVKRAAGGMRAQMREQVERPSTPTQGAPR